MADPISPPRVGGIASSVTFADAATARATQLLNGNIYLTDKAAWTPGGTLTVSGLAAYDRVSILHQGNGAGEVGVDGTTILFGGVAIGTVSGGSGTTLTVTFNTAADADAVTAVTERLAYRMGPGGAVSDHSLHIALVDGAGVAAANAGQWEQLSDDAHTGYDIASLVTPYLFRPTLGDVDGDGYADLVLTGRFEEGSDWRVVDYDDPEFAAWEENIRYPIHMITEDGVHLMRDGEAGNEAAKVYLNDRNGGFIAVGSIGTGINDVAGTLYDYNGDGLADFIWAWQHPTSGERTINVSISTGDGHFGSGFNYAYLGGSLSLSYHWDPASYLAAGPAYPGGPLRVLGGIGWSTFEIRPGDGILDFYPQLSGAGSPAPYTKPFMLDYDGDGDLDTVISGVYELRYLENIGNGTLVERSGSANPFNGLFSFSDNSAFGDLDHDGDLDLVVVQADGITRVLWNNSSYGTKSNSTDGTIRLDFGFEGDAGTPHDPTGGIALGGAPIQGEVLTVKNTLADEDGMGALHYQWQRDSGSGFVDVGSDQSTYTLGATDVGGTIRVTVSYTDGLDMSESFTSTLGYRIISDVRTTQNILDTVGDKSWASIITRFDSLGGVASEAFTLDNGGVWINQYDTGDASPILWTSKRYDASNNFVQRMTSYDDGTHALTIYDPQNLYGWFNLTINFDANWNQTGIAGLRDDYTPGISQFEVDNVLDSILWFTTPYDPSFGAAAANDGLLGGGGADVMYGFAGDDMINGAGGNDFIVGGLGSDTLTGGAGSDRFWFRTGDGLDLVTDFEAGRDVLDLHGYGVADFADLLARMVEDGDKVVITLDAENAITLDHVAIGDLAARDFMFS